ncbi:MAG: type IV pilus assembly protein PilM [Oligoflexales bacterium]|nr:type IV pilus assembly protein PilM [Oligoflexales bacterium]
MFLEPSFLAVDIGSSSVKVMEINRNKKKIVGLGIEFFQHSSIVNGEIQDPLPVSLAIKSGIKKIRARKLLRRVITSLDSSSVIIKKVPFSVREDVSIQEIVYYEAEQHLQQDMNNLYFDFHVFEEQTINAQLPVLLVGAKKHIVDQRVSLLKSSGLRIGAFDCDVLALANAFSYSYGTVDGVVILIDVGSQSTQVVFIGDGQYLFTREIGVCGDIYTKAIAHELDISFQSAEKMKISRHFGSPDSAAKVQKVMQELNQQFASELQMIVDYFLQHGEIVTKNRTIRGVFLSGGSILTWGLSSLLSESIAFPISKLNPFQNIDVAKHIPEDLLKSSHLFSVSFGLAIRNFEEMGDLKS